MQATQALLIITTVCKQFLCAPNWPLGTCTQIQLVLAQYHMTWERAIVFPLPSLPAEWNEQLKINTNLHQWIHKEWWILTKAKMYYKPILIWYSKHMLSLHHLTSDAHHHLYACLLYTTTKRTAYLNKILQTSHYTYIHAGKGGICCACQWQVALRIQNMTLLPSALSLSFKSLMMS